LTRGKYLRPDLYGEALENMSLTENIFCGQKRLAHLCTNEDILWIDDGIGGLVAVGRSVNSLGATIMFLSVNGKIVTSTQWDLNMMTLAGHLPMMLHRNVRNALVVGLGSGITAGEMLHYPLEQLDVVEISPEVVNACHLFAPFHNNLLTDPRVHIIVQDARTHVTLTDRTYDAIVSDPINPWVAGSAQLFTLDHFRRVKSRLNPGGVFVQWFHAYQSDWEVFSMFGRTFRQAFPNSLLVNTAILGPDYLFIGFQDDHQPMLNPAVPENNFRYAAKSANLRLSNPAVIYPLIVTDVPASLFGEGRRHTDEHPYMEYLAPRHAYTGGSDFTDVVVTNSRRSPLLQSLLSPFDSVSNQLAFADFMASVNVAPFGLVRPGDASSSQMEQYRHIVESYCRVNMVEDYSRLTPSDQAICLPVQERLILAHIEQLTAAGAGSWSIGCAFFDLAGIYVAGHDYQTAIACYQQGLVHLPDHQTGLLNLAACYERLQEYDKAVDVLRRLTSIRPRSARLMTLLAANYLKLGNQDEALRCLDEALRHDGNHVPALVAAGMIHGTKGDYARAISYSRKALKINPGAVNAYQNLAIALSRVGEPDQALAYAERGLALDPANAEMLSIRNGLRSALPVKEPVE
jgi:spermidine synthase